MVVTDEIGFARPLGRIVEEGSPDDIIEAPKNERTRMFFSSILRH
jgi:ABC-type histidine transport system ATPase subunit